MVRWVLIGALLLTSLQLRGQCTSPRTVDRGVQLYQRNKAVLNSGFWDEFRSMFNFWNPPPVLPFRQSVAFLVGVSNYRHPDLKKLPGVENDLDQMCGYLLGKGGFDQVYVARGTAATSATVTYYMIDFFHENKNVGENDRLLFYFSGHGADDGGGDAYLLFGGATPGEFGNDQVLAVDAWEKWSNRIPAKHALFIFDACVAGEVLLRKAPRETAQQRARGLMDTLSGGGSRTVVTAGTASQETWYATEKSLGYSVFTNSLLKVLQDPGGEPLMSIDEAVERSANLTAAYTHDRQASPAIPDARRFESAKRNGRFEFLDPDASNRKVPDVASGFLNGKGANAGTQLMSPETIGSLDLVAEAASIRMDPALSLYLGVRAADMSSEDSPLPELENLIGESLNEGSNYALFRTGNVVFSVAWSPDGKTMALGDFNGKIELRDVDSGKILRTLDGNHKYIESLSWSPDGRTLASVSADGTDLLWDTVTGLEIRTLGFVGLGNTSWSPDSKVLALAGYSNQIRLWNVSQGRTIRSITNSELKGVVTGTAWSPDGKVLASGTNFGIIQLWDTGTGRLLRTLPRTGYINGLAWSHDGRKLASTSGDNTVRLWDPGSGELLHLLAGHSAYTTSVAWSGDDKTLASGSADKTIRLWDPDSGGLLRTFMGHTGAVLRVNWSSDGQRLASVGEDGTVRLWELASGQGLRKLVHPDDFASAAWSPDGTILALACWDHMIYLWDPSTGRMLRTLSGHQDIPVSVAWSSDGKMLASAGMDSTIRIWDPNSNKALRILTGHTNTVGSVAWSPNNKFLASASLDGTIKIWDPTSGQLLRTLGRSSVKQNVTWSPDGKTLASTGWGNTIQLWDPSSGEPLLDLKGHTNSIRNVTWSPDGKMLASASVDGTIRLWEAGSGQQLQILRIGDAVSVVAWSPDGGALATGSADGVVRLWNPVNGRILRTLRGHTKFVSSLAWSPDSKILASTGEDRTLWLWPGSFDELLKRAKTEIRLYTPSDEECQRYFESASCPIVY